MEPVRTTAIVEVLVEVQVGTWGDDSNVGEIVKTATREARDKLVNVLTSNRVGKMRVIRAQAVRVVAHAAEREEE
jgi:hypothetical protein